MKLSDKTLEQLRIIINGDDTPDYRSVSELVSFFDDLGFDDTDGYDSFSRKLYTNRKLKELNGTRRLDKCLKKTFAVSNYVGCIDILDSLITNFNQYMALDKWKIVRENANISFRKLDKVVIDDGKSAASEIKEDEFLKKHFDVNVDALGLNTNFNDIINRRLAEIEYCISGEAPLASILLIGSVMEGILLEVAKSYPQQFNQTPSAPKDKDSNKVRAFHRWTLNNLIDVAFEVGVLNQDVKEFSHVVRNFRNYIHPFEQMSSGFSPDHHTASICFQVLKAVMSQIGTFRKNQDGQSR
jgi:hypothetical protein